MTIASAITNAQNKIANAYTALSNKGATLPVTQNLSNMPSCINSIKSAEFYNFVEHGFPYVDRATGIITNFSSYNYLTIGDIDLTTANSWEMVACFSANTINQYQFWYQNPIAIGLDNSNHLHIWSLPDGDIYSDVTFEVNVTYWVKVEFTGTQYNAYRKTSKDGAWQQIISTNSSNKVIITSTPTYIGLNPNNTNEYFSGYIDLSECYIKVDNVVVWSPSGLPSSYIVGSLTESDGKLSGFSGSDYVDTNYVYSALSADKVDIQVHFKTPATAFSSFEPLIMLTSNWYYGINIAVRPNNEGFMVMYQTEQQYIDATLQTNTEYWVKLSSNGDGAIHLYYSTGGSTWTAIGNDIPFKTLRSDSSTRVGQQDGTPSAGFEGQIYRDGTLIKINNNTVWSM